MRENLWKYVSLILVLLLAMMSVSAVLLYMQNSSLRGYTPANVTSVSQVQVENVSCNNTELLSEISELKGQIDFLKRFTTNGTPSNTTIAVVPLFGLIDDYTALYLVPVLRRIADNSSIGGVILWIESPGGEVGAVRDIYTAVRKLDLIKPVVAYTGGMAASGGYYVAVASDRIIADPLAEVGSIGVIYVHYDMEKNYAQNGIKVDVFKTGKYKDMGAEWRALTPEERRMITNMVDTYFEAFLTAVSTGRNMTINETRKYATGRTWFAVNVTGTLVDSTGDMDTAIRTLENMLNVTNARVVVYSGPKPENFGVYGSEVLFLDPRYLNTYIRR